MRLIREFVYDGMMDATSANTESRSKLQASGVPAPSIFLCNWRIKRIPFIVHAVFFLLV